MGRPFLGTAPGGTEARETGDQVVSNEAFQQRERGLHERYQSLGGGGGSCLS